MRVVWLGLGFVLAVALGATLANTLQLDLGSLALQARLPKLLELQGSAWTIALSAFVAGAAVVALCAAVAATGSVLVSVLAAAALLLLVRLAGALVPLSDANATVVLVLGGALFAAAILWKHRARIATGWTRLGNGLHGLADWTHKAAGAPASVPVPPRLLMLLVLLLLASPLLVGNGMLVRGALAIALGIAGIVLAMRAARLIQGGERIELWTGGSSFGISQGGWRLSTPASLVVLTAVLLAAAVGVSPADRPAGPAAADPAKAGEPPKRDGITPKPTEPKVTPVASPALSSSDDGN